LHPEEFREMQALEEGHWWFRGKRLLLEALLARAGVTSGRMLDVGCGTGGILRALAGRGRVVGIDYAEIGLRYCRTKGLRDVLRASALALPFRDGAFDLCVLMDVLEHVDDEARLLGEVRRVLRPGGAAIVSVPAFQALWSPHDEVLEHRRRYRRKELVARVRESGLEVGWASYTNFFVFPPALAWRTLRRWTGVAPERRTDFFHLPPAVNSAIVGAYRAEAALIRRLPLPFGVSVACVASAPRDDVARGPRRAA
jgi:SAM-dependent methyltransferase